MYSHSIMVEDSPSVLTSSIKQPLLEKIALESSSSPSPSSHQTKTEMRRQYKRRVEKSRLAAAASSSQNGNLTTTSDAEDRQGVIDCDTSLLVASTSETDSITNIPTSITSGFTSITSAEQQRTRSQSLQSQSIDEQIIVPMAKTFPLSNIGINEHAQQQPQSPQQPQQQSIESPTLPPKPQSVSPKPHSVWSDSHRKDPTREDRRSTLRTPPPTLPPISDRTKINLSPRPSNPINYRRSSTYESAASSTVVDDALMDRALYIRENLRKYEMLELAAEAERAAESGMEKFVGSASKYVEESPDQTPTYSEQRKQFADPFTPSMITPQRSRGLLELDPLEFTPSSYFSTNNTKKIKVSALRKFSDVVPNFNDMHSNIRFHLQRSGVDETTLPEKGSRMALVKNDTIDSDAHSQAPSLGSFGSYAASSLKSSLSKGVADLLGRSRSNPSNKNNVPGDFSIVNKSSSAMSTLEGEKSLVEGEKSIKPLWEPAEEEDERIIEKSASVDFIKAKRPLPLFPPSVQTARSTDLGGDRSMNSRRIPPLLTSKSETNVLATESDDSDDSSVEVYGRKSKSPLNTSQTEENDNNQNEVKPTLTRSRSVQAFPSFENSYRGSSSNKVSFEDPLGSSLGCRSCSPEAPLLRKEKTIDSVDETGTVLSLFDKLQQRFSASIDEFRGDDLPRNPFAVLKSAKENKMFLSNYFYTERDGKGRDDVANLKIDISQTRKDSEAFCIGYCADDDTKLVNSCETLGKFVTSAFEWMNTKKSDSTAFSGRSDSVPAFSNLYNTDTGHDREKRVFAPPRLSERCVMNMKFPSVDDLRQPKSLKEGNLDCSEIVVCDGCNPNKAK